LKKLRLVGGRLKCSLIKQSSGPVVESLVHVRLDEQGLLVLLRGLGEEAVGLN
jgi:hypothetical protein